MHIRDDRFGGRTPNNLFPDPFPQRKNLIVQFLYFLLQVFGVECFNLSADTLAFLADSADVVFEGLDVVILLEDKYFIFTQNELDGFLDLGDFFVMPVDFFEETCENLDIFFVCQLEVFQDLALFGSDAVAYWFELFSNVVFFSRVTVVQVFDLP